MTTGENTPSTTSATPVAKFANRNRNYILSIIQISYLSIWIDKSRKNYSKPATVIQTLKTVLQTSTDTKFWWPHSQQQSTCLHKEYKEATSPTSSSMKLGIAMNLNYWLFWRHLWKKEGGPKSSSPVIPINSDRSSIRVHHH